MRALLVIATLLICTACSSMKPVDTSPEQMIQGILIQLDDRVKIGTSDGEFHEFQVTAITHEHISGDSTEIAIEDVLTAEILEATTLNKAILSTAVLTMTLAFWAAISALIAAVVTLGL